MKFWIPYLLLVVSVGYLGLHKAISGHFPPPNNYSITHLSNPDGTYDLSIKCIDGHYPENMVKEGHLIVSCNN